MDTAGTGSLASSSGSTDATQFHLPHSYLLLSKAIVWKEERRFKILPEHVVYQ